MNLNVDEWKEFYLGKLFDIRKGKRLTAADQEDGNNNYIGAIDSNNGVANHIGQAPIHEGNTISLSYNGSVGEAFYQFEPYWATDDVNALYSYYDDFNQYIGLFIATVLRKEKYKFSYGRKWTLENMNVSIIKLPIQHNADGTPYIDSNHIYSEDGYVPDWQFMEDYMKSLHHKPLTTKSTVGNGLALNVDKWKYFYLKNICDISMGNKMDWSAMTMDNPEVNFVGRSADDNGVAGKVDIVDGVEPYDSGCITVALGGSLGATYVQNEKFYTSQNVSVLKFEDSVSDGTKLFISCLIMNESKYKYFPFGRELNTHIRTDFGFTLPIKHNPDGTPYIDPNCTYSEDGYVPDWQFMEDYIKALPYGDRL
ncbi:restriction endonuclease subunit S [Blautia sp.]|uniref:restriction endonuclease subunit S n=1 Tax=Blautia sp. TaxID=1955243 RepID=UPI002607F991|nr:restriction endonuclease subunit S [Blautia sp.]